MSQQPAPPRSASLLPPVLLVLLLGLALAWVIRDLASMPPAQVLAPGATAGTATPAPTAVPTARVAGATATIPLASATPVPSPTLEPSAAPTVTPVPSATASPTATPAIIGYQLHRVAEGEQLGAIAANGGSTVDLVRAYNRLGAELLPGRALVVPQLAGQTSILPGEAVLVQRGRSDRPWVALTLDAGASSEPAAAMLQVLRERNIRITFFLTGRWIRENPELARQIVADGHEIANHSFSHPDFRILSDAQIAQELADTEQALQEVAGPGATTRPLFRPPYGAYDERVLRVVGAQGYLPIYWTLDSLDSVGEPKTAAFLLERVTTRLTPEELRGAIILAHVGSAATAEALPAILDRFAELGLEIRTVSEVLG